MTKKFLDEIGLETLWNKIKSEDTTNLAEAKAYADEKIKDTGGFTSDDLTTILEDYATKSYSDNRMAYFTYREPSVGADLYVPKGSDAANRAWLSIRYGFFSATAKTTYNISLSPTLHSYYKVITQDVNAQADSTNSGYIKDVRYSGFSFVSKSNTSRTIHWIVIEIA